MKKRFAEYNDGKKDQTTLNVERSDIFAWVNAKPWEPILYRRFKHERAMPFHDLLPLIHMRSDMKVSDIGSGQGDLTLELANRLPKSEVLGLDNDSEMLKLAKLRERPGLRFEEMAIEDFLETGTRYDLIFSNAALQHVTQPHTELIPKLISKVLPGGQLVIQIPSPNLHDQPFYRFAKRTAQIAPFREALQNWVRPLSTLQVDQYAELFCRHGGRAITAIDKAYIHILNGPDDVLNWALGASIRPYLTRLPDDKSRIAFVTEYRQRLHTQYPEGPVCLCIRRLLLVATF